MTVLSRIFSPLVDGRNGSVNTLFTCLGHWSKGFPDLGRKGISGSSSCDNSSLGGSSFTQKIEPCHPDAGAVRVPVPACPAMKLRLSPMACAGLGAPCQRRGKETRQSSGGKSGNTITGSAGMWPAADPVPWARQDPLTASGHCGRTKS